MKKKILKCCGAVFAALVISASAFAQQAKLEPFQIQRSAFIEQIKLLKTSNPKMSADEFVTAANLLLDKNGIGFAFSFDNATCERIRKIKNERADPNSPLKLGATLKSVDAEGATLSLPEPGFSTPECGGCTIQLPVLQVTEKDFITVVTGRNIRFHMPANFSANEVFLLDPNNHAAVKRKWRIPFRSVPIGISHDENVLYMGFEEPELSDLAFLVFGEGVFQIATRVEAENGGKGKMVDLGPKAPVSLSSKIKFERWNNSYILSFRNACPRN